MKIKIFWVLIVMGMILRIFIALFTFHPDINYYALASASYLRGNLNPYEKAGELSPGATLDKLPLGYFLNLPFHLLARPLVVDKTEKTFFINREKLFGDSSFWIFLTYAKAPMIAFDIALAILLTWMVSTPDKKKVLFIWMVNPLTLWVTSAIGQIDIYVAFFLALCYFFLKKGRTNLAALALGLGGGIKTAPFLLLPLLLGLETGLRKKVIIFLISLVPLVVTVVPYLGSRDFRENAIFVPQLSKSLYANLPLSGGESIFIVVALLTFLYFVYLSKNRNSQDFLNFSIAILLLTFSFTHFHIQWFLWVMPLLLLWFLNHWDQGTTLASIILFGSLTLMLFLFDSSLQVKLLAPLLPFLDKTAGLAEILHPQEVFNLKSFAATIFAASSVFLTWRILKRV